MAVSDLFEMLDAFIPDDNDEVNKVSSNDETHLSLWRRANFAVKVLIKEQRKDEATRCMIAFFRDFEDLIELESVVREIEDLVIQPAGQKESKLLEHPDSSSSDRQPDSSS